MDSYFIKLKQIQYGNTVTRDITERVIAQELVSTRNFTYYPFEIPEGMRADQVAEKYYEDASRDWVFFLTNNLTDPYYDWYLSSDEFDNYIISKYGSSEYAKQLVFAYRTNWVSDQSILTISYYNSLPDANRKYFVPIFGEGPNIIGYQRRPVDWIVSTNRILNCSVTMSGNTPFGNNDIVQCVNGGFTVANAQVNFSNSSTVYIQHVAGSVTANSTLVSVSNSLINATVTAVTSLIENIPLTEEAYWERVYYWDAENELNQSKRFIDVLGDANILQFTEDVRQQLAQ